MTQGLFPLALMISGLGLTDVSSAQVPARQPGEAAAAVIPVPDQVNLDAWERHIVPSAAELRWQQIPWHPSFGDGLAAAGRAGKPLLFWGMNGHPLGCT